MAPGRIISKHFKAKPEPLSGPLPLINAFLAKAVSTGQNEISPSIHADATFFFISQLFHPTLQITSIINKIKVEINKSTDLYQNFLGNILVFIVKCLHFIILLTTNYFSFHPNVKKTHLSSVKELIGSLCIKIAIHTNRQQILSNMKNQNILHGCRISAQHAQVDTHEKTYLEAMYKCLLLNSQAKNQAEFLGF